LRKQAILAKASAETGERGYMNREETVALFLRGREAWNAWAEKMLAQQDALRADSHSVSSADTWDSSSKVDFSFCEFATGEPAPKQGLAPQSENSKLVGADFSGFIFPGVAHWNNAVFADHPDFTGAIFHGSASFHNASFPDRAWFRGTLFRGEVSLYLSRFHGDCHFSDSRFSAPVSFNKVTFSGCAFFNGAVFSDNVDFIDAHFEKAASFRNCIFSGLASFHSVRFDSGVDLDRGNFHQAVTFHNASFTKGASFESAKFREGTQFNGASFGGPAWFKGAEFFGDTSFWVCRFEHTAVFADVHFGTLEEPRNANFGGIKADRAFLISKAFFSRVPVFEQADLKQAPDLDDVEFPLPNDWFWRRGDPTLIPHYRAIRRMAIQGADYDREQMAFKGEIRSKRRTEHKLSHGAFWLGLIYDALSDFGRSIARPFWIGAASLFAFAAIYLWNAGVAFSEWGSACAGDGAYKALKAITLSFANALPLIGSSRSEVAAEFYNKCLALPHAPVLSPLLQIWQTLWSTMLIFLFLLALRNQFKIK
jgi:uncharacterized protein YjbI with pentapeptide repeats